MSIVLGYAITGGYVLLLIYLVGPVILKLSNLETSRKVIHTMLFMVWVFINRFFRGTVHQVLIPVLFLILNTLSYRFHLYRTVEREDNSSMGTIYFAIAIGIIMTISYIFPETHFATGIASFCLTLGDGFAGIVGYNLPSPKIRNKKSLAGYLANITACIIGLLIFNAAYSLKLGFAAIIVISGLSGISELVDHGLDNFSVTFLTFIAGYMALEHYPGILSSLAAAELVFHIVFFSKDELPY